jgi:cell division protein FtsL
MSTNRRRHANSLPLASMMMWLLVCAFVGAAGLGYVSLKNQLHTNASEIKRLEGELDSLVSRVRNSQERIKELSAQTKVEEAWKRDGSKLGGLRKIVPTDHVVYVNRPIQRPIDSDPGELQQTANIR